MSLSKRFKRALDRENIAISLNQSRNKRVIRKAFEQSEGNTITDRVVSLVEKGLKAEAKKDKAYREDKPENWKQHLQEDTTMDKSKLVDFIKSNFGEPEFKHTEKPLEDCSKGFLEGYISTRLQGKGVDIRMDEMEDVDLSYLEGLLEGSGGKVDTARLREDSRETSRPSGKAKENREALGEMYSQSVKIQDSELKQKVESGEISRAEALRQELKDMHDAGNTEPQEDQSQAEANKEKLQNMHEGE